MTTASGSSLVCPGFPRLKPNPKGTTWPGNGIVLWPLTPNRNNCLSYVSPTHTLFTCV